MRGSLKCGACVTALVLLTIVPARAQTFSYNDTFDEYWQEYWDLNGYVPAGWDTWNSMEFWQAGAPLEDNPRCFGGDYGWWGDFPGSSPWATPLGHTQDYGVAWSNDPAYSDAPIRFNLIHPAWNPNGRVASAWFVGDTAAPPGVGIPEDPNVAGAYIRHWTGSYPLDLTTDFLRAEFDLSLRTGNDWCGQYSNGMWVAADAISFCVQTVGEAPPASPGTTFYRTDRSHYALRGGWLGVGGLTGFNVEFDIYPNGPDPGTYPGDQNNHVGLNVALTNPGAGEFPSVATNVDLPVPLPFAMQNVSDNNQPIHVTVYYNDPAHGGLGVVQVYIKIRAADWDAATPVVGPGTPPFSFGEGVTDPPDGILVLQGCVGAWPAGVHAMFGFTASTGGCNAVLQTDNVNVTTDTAGAGTPCAPTFLPAVTPGTPVTLTAAPVALNDALLTQPGWDVDLCIQPSPWWWGDPGYDGDVTHRTPLDTIKDAIAAGVPVTGTSVGEPSISYIDAGVDAPLPWFRVLASQLSDNQHYYGMICRGWIYFPQAGTFTLVVNSDNEYELKIGGQLIGTDPINGSWGSSFNSGAIFDLTVNTPGVYPIQLIYGERWGGAFVEFYRRTTIPLMPYLALGTDSFGLADQPLVYGLHAGLANLTDLGTPAPLPWPIPVVDLLASQKVGDIGDVPQSGGGPDPAHQVFKVKAFQSPLGAGTNIFYASGFEADPIVPERLADVLGTWSTSPYIDYTDGWWMQWPGAASGGLPGGVNIAADHLAFRAEGYIYFPAPGAYFFGVVGDDYHRISLGGQVFYYGACCQEPSLISRVNVAEAGLYPIRIDWSEGGGGAGLEFTQVGTGHAWVLVNGPGSTVQVYDSLANPAQEYVWMGNGKEVPANRKVAEVGQGGTPGWVGKLAQIPAGAGGGVPLLYSGVATAAIENDLYFPGTDSHHAIATVTPELAISDVLAFNDPTGDAGNPGRVPIIHRWSEFGAPALADNNDNFSASFTGYIEFPTAGDYLFNVYVADGGWFWIGGVDITGWWNDTGGTGENTFMSVRVHEAGIYDIRVDYLANADTSALELLQYKADGTPLLPNAEGNPVKVYQTLAVPALTTAYRNPMRIPASAKAGEIFAGGDLGMQVEIVNAEVMTTETPAYPVWGWDGHTWGSGNDRFVTMSQATELLDKVLGVKPSLRQFGTLVSSATHTTVDFGDATWPAGTGSTVDQVYFGARVTGLLALKAGGHLINVSSDDGADVWVAGQNVANSESLHGEYPTIAYVYVEEDGLYPFTVDYINLWGGRSLRIYEGVASNDLGTGDLVLTWTLINTGNASKAYANVAPCGTPWVNADADTDVDQADYGFFQACFTGTPSPNPLDWPCKCYDRDFNGNLDATDMTKFLQCWSGPAVAWTASVDCPN